MADNTDSGITNLSGFRGNFGVKVGTWTAGVATTAITIASGGTAIIMAGVNVATGLVGQSAVPTKLSYSFVDGNPDLTLTPFATTDSGTYWMFVKLS